MSKALFKAAKGLAQRLEVFRALAMQAHERRDAVLLDPREMWEPADQAALTAYYECLNQGKGLAPLPFPESAATDLFPDEDPEPIEEVDA